MLTRLNQVLGQRLRTNDSSSDGRPAAHKADCATPHTSWTHLQHSGVRKRVALVAVESQGRRPRHEHGVAFILISREECACCADPHPPAPQQTPAATATAPQAVSVGITRDWMRATDDLETQELRMRAGDAAGWPQSPTQLPRQEWGPLGALPPGSGGRQSDAREAAAAERDLMRSSRQLKPAAGGSDLGPVHHDPASLHHRRPLHDEPGPVHHDPGSVHHGRPLEYDTGSLHRDPVSGHHGRTLLAPAFQGRSGAALGSWTARWQPSDEAGVGASEEGAPFRAVELGRRNLLTLRFNDPDLERRFRARHAEGSGTTDSWGDPFLLVLCLLTLVVRAKSLSERGFTAVLVLALIAKMLLRAQARAAYLRHRVAVVSATRILVMLTSALVGSIQLARPGVYVISGSLVSLCCAIFINTRLVTFTLYPIIMPLPWATDLPTTIAGLGMVLTLLVPKLCTPEHLSHGPTAAVTEYLAAAIDEACGGPVGLGLGGPGQDPPQAQCLKLHVFAQVFWGCIVPLTAAYILESAQRAIFAKEAALQAAPPRTPDASIGSGAGYQGAAPAAPSSSAQSSHDAGWPAALARGYPGAAPSSRRFAAYGGEDLVDAGSSFDEELPIPVAGDLLVAAAVMPAVGAALWHLLRLLIGWQSSLLPQLLPT